MREKDKNIDKQQDAEVKFEKLLEVAKDIEEKGQNDGDLFLRQTVLSAVVKSENDLLFEKLENALFDETYSDMFKTIVAGLFLNKGNEQPLSKYVDFVINEDLILDESFEKKEALILAADGLVEYFKRDDKNNDENVLNSLFKLFTASCNAKSSAIIADILLQRFIGLLPNKSKIIDDKLKEIILNKDYEFNTRLISVDILGRSKPFDFFNAIEDLMINLADFTNSNTDQLYFLDVVTKILKSIIKRGLSVDYLKSLKWLDIGDIDEIMSRAKQEAEVWEIKDTAHLDVISKRIKERITEINSLHYSSN